MIQCVTPFGEWDRQNGGKEYCGLRTTRYTYVKDFNGPWLFFDNQSDPYQQKNLVADPTQTVLRAELDGLLLRKLKERNDEFLPGETYIKKWDYKVDARGTVPYTQ